MAFNEAFTDLVLKQMPIDPETNNIINKDDKYWETIRKGLQQGQKSCDTPSLALQYCYTYLLTHFDAYQSMLVQEQPIIQQLRHAIFNARRKILMVDFGCGPMTSGLALADYGLRRYGIPPNLVYIGIDNQEYMLQKAHEFSSRQDVFGEEFFSIFMHKGCGDQWEPAEIRTISQYADPGMMLILNFSYLFGQNSVNFQMVQELGQTVRNIIRECGVQNTYSIYLNVSHLPEKYNHFLANLMHAEFRSNSELQKLGYRYRVMRGLQIQDSRDRYGQEFTYEVLPIPLEAV